MFQYILKRLLYFLPTIIAISLMAFVVSTSAPADPVERLAKSADTEGGGADQSSVTGKKVKQEIRQKLGLDLPLFYVSINSLATPDTLYKFIDKGHRENLGKLVKKYGNWKEINQYYKSLKTLSSAYGMLNADSIEKKYSTLIQLEDTSYLMKEYNKGEIAENINNASILVVDLLETNDEEIMAFKTNKLKSLQDSLEYLVPAAQAHKNMVEAQNQMKNNASVWKTFVPSVKFYGFNNQYHRWVFGKDQWWLKADLKNKGFIGWLFGPWTRDIEKSKGLLRADFGYSYVDGQPIFKKIKQKFLWSFILAVLSITVAYIVSLPLGIWAAYKKNSAFDRSSSVVLFILYSLPTFFIGTLLIYLFANPDVLVWFPESGVKDPATFKSDWGLLRKIKHHAPYLVLPLITYTLGSFAFLSRIMRVGMLEVLSQDYIRTARAKGLNEKIVIFKHALRNSLLPIITVFASIFPAAIGGSVIIEVIFSIPGMGLEIFNAVLNYDYPMIVSIFTLIGILTMVGLLVSDILYSVVDPRISFK